MQKKDDKTRKVSSLRRRWRRVKKKGNKRGLLYNEHAEVTMLADSARIRDQRLLREELLELLILQPLTNLHRHQHQVFHCHQKDNI